MGYMSPEICPDCGGHRLKPASLAVKVKDRTIGELTRMSIRQALETVKGWTLTGREKLVGGRPVDEIRNRLDFLMQVGLEYLSLERSAATLSGGEAQRIRLATQIGSRLRGVLYVLDEPSIGLHPRDNDRLLTSLAKLRDLGNTVLVVEHDADTIERADYVIDLGPGAGRLGGHLVAQGTPDEIARNVNSLTGQYLTGARQISLPEKRRKSTAGSVIIKGASEHNLRNIDVEFPLGLLTLVTGVSGSGKSTLINDILYRAAAKAVYGSRAEPGAHASITGLDLIDKVIEIDQSAIGRTPRSNPATYTQVFTPIRDLYAMLPESRERGYKPGRFSFNVKGGRCEECQGEGVITTQLYFMPDVEVTCGACKGARFNAETLEVTLRGKTIDDILNMSVEEGVTFFAGEPSVGRKIQVLADLGLGYLTLGQSATTLSGGEAQRIKIATELSTLQRAKHTVYILDEPTTGLHLADIQRLLESLNKLVDAGHTVLLIEHHLDVIKTADHVIDLGPDGGHAGGEVVATGTPEAIARCKASHTGRFLKAHLSV